MKINQTMLFASLLIAAGMLAACGGGGSSGPEVRSTVYGEVLGVDDGAGSGTYYWKGLPFAKAPTGTLRWKAPVEPDAWSAPLQTKNFGNACIQNGRLYGPGSNNTYDATIGT
ncbi:MAG TPA: carboxylesterase family protein, partial [Noviherbaspirillum sp.]|nr:carboxylesterase family protein [Noviherbaspirillum sp.]